mgnify:CR=1 FL=1
MTVRILVNPTLIFLFFLSFSTVFSQNSASNNAQKGAYQHALKLYKNNSFGAAYKIFSDIASEKSIAHNLQSNAAYYSAVSAVKLNMINANKLVQDFVTEFPNNDKKEKVYLEVGHYYFKKNNPKVALKWYEKVVASSLSKIDLEEFNFKMGYVLFKTGDLKRAENRFFSLIDSPEYSIQARYYYGFITYQQGDYKTAETYLTKVATEKTYANDVNYYLLDINFKAGKFSKAIEIGNALLTNVKAIEKSEISKIVGESYFNLKQYKKAIPFLKNYKGKQGKWNNTDFYLLGYAYYKQNDYLNAVGHFNKIIGSSNSVSQNAYYHLAKSYLFLNKKLEALNAFKNASEMDFDKRIKEDAYLNYVKLSYEEGNPYKSVAEVLQDFLKAYPNSSQYTEVNKLVVTSFIFQQDYQGALNYLSKKKSHENSELSNDVSLYRGIQLFNQFKLKEALTFFNKAKKSSDKDIKAIATYWNAETDYQLSNFQNAVRGFIQFKNNTEAKKLDEYNKIDYALAYAYFKLKEYGRAATSFDVFLSKSITDKTLKDDAAIRLADCYFVTKKYTKAINAYENVIKNKGIGADYANYQKGISYGFLGQNQLKIDNLLSVITKYQNTSLKDDALFQLANTYVATKDNPSAHKTFTNLISNFPKSSYVSKAMLRQGLLYYNENDHRQALAKFKSIVKNYAGTNEAQEAVINARNVYVDIGAVDEYANWVKNISFVNITDTDVDDTMYESAENKFLENDLEKAIDGFQKYITRFPSGLHAIKANFYLAQSLIKNNQTEAAIPNYQFVIDQNQSEFSEESLNKLAQIYLEKELWNEATPLLERLEVEANYPQNILFAQSNLMKSYYQSGNLAKAVEFAKKVLNNEKLNSDLESDAKVIIARTAIQNKDFTIAKKYYEEVEKTAKGEVMAEALFYSAYFKNDAKKYKESNIVVQKLIADYSTYKFWGVKSYIIMAKNHYGLKDAYQATYILENIIKNFSQFKDVITEAEKELKNIQTIEAKTNDSVSPKN